MNQMTASPQNYHRSDLHPLPMRVSRLQIERLRDLRSRDGLSVQEHVRRSIDQYLERLDGPTYRGQLPSGANEVPERKPPLPVSPALSDQTGQAIADALRSAPIKKRGPVRVRQR